MERVTEWRGEHAAVMNNRVNYIDRLARYEDTGLEPEEVVELQKQSELFAQMKDDLEICKEAAMYYLHPELRYCSPKELADTFREVFR